MEETQQLILTTIIGANDICLSNCELGSASYTNLMCKNVT